MKKITSIIRFVLCLIILLQIIDVFAQSPVIKYIPAEIDFSEKIVDWDGFGFNYVETAQTRDYSTNPQDYGGFSLLKEEQKKEIAELVFGKNGLQVQIIKMFLDPWHQLDPKTEPDHKRTTKNMLSFIELGMKISKNREDSLEIITTLYGPPAWATQQKLIGGRDLDIAQSENLGIYMANWVKFLKEKNMPIKYLSLHNEGEDFYRWNFDDGMQRLLEFDYNLYWAPDQVNHFLKLMPGILSNYGLNDVKITNGEPSCWTRFFNWGYTYTLFKDDEALKNLGLLTTHGFIHGDFKKLPYGLADANTTGLLRQKKPELHSWITSYSWGNMGTDFVKAAHEHIYSAHVNALIPWAGIQNPSKWIGGDPNPGSAIRVNDDGTYQILTGYYFYKQLTIAGRRGMSVARASLANPVAFVIAFGRNGTRHPDAFIVTSNIYIWSLPLEIKISGTKSTRFKAYRSSEDGKEQFLEVGVFEVKNGALIYDPPKGTTTTFIAID